MKQVIKTFLALLVLLISSTGAWAQEKSYFLDENGDPHDFYYSSYTALTSSGTSVTIGGDYYVEGNVTIDGTVAMNANTRIILCDGATLTINGGSGKGINDNTHHLAIYGQSSGSHAGKLVVSGAAGAISCDIFAIYSGQVQATSTGGCGIEAKSVYLNNGQVTATGATKDIYANNGGGLIRIYGGKVTANGSADNIYSMGEIVIEGGQVTANSGTSGIYATNITLGWTCASDFIRANNYTGNVRTATDKSFNISGGGTLNANADVDKATVAGKWLTPNATETVYNVIIGYITNGSVVPNKTKAFAGERVVLTPTPDAGYYYYDMSCTDEGSNDVAITKNVGDYQITMPAADVTVIASFGDKVAKNINTDTEYASLKNALNDVSSGETIKILTDITGEGSNTKDVGSKDITIDLNGKSVVFGEIDIMQNLTIKNGTLKIGKIYNASTDNNYAITFDNATVTVNSVGGNALEWYANNLVLKNGSHVTIKEHLFLGGGSGPTVTIVDINSWLELIDCTVSGYASEVVIEAAFAPYLQPGKTLIADGSTLNTVGFRKTWGLELVSNLTNATVTTYKSDTEPTAAFIDNPGDIASFADAGDYIVMHIVPNNGYWTDQMLLMAMETVAALAPSMRAPGIVLGQPLTKLGSDHKVNGEGWYYYQIPAEHGVGDGYITSTVDGFMVPKFDLSTATVDATDTKTYHVSNGDWNTTISIDENSFTYNGAAQGPQLSGTTLQIKKGTDDACTLPLSGNISLSGTETNANTTPYNATLSNVANGCFTDTKAVPFTINKKTLTITADDASKVYDGTALTKNSYTHTTTATGDVIESVTITGSQTTVGSSNNVPSAAVIKNASDVNVTANYDITYTNGTLTVTKKTVKDNPDANNGEGTVNIVLTDISVDGFTYNGNGQKPTITVKDGTNADAQVIPASEYTVTIKDANGNTVDNPTNVGTYTVVITDNDGGNYDVSGETTFTINKKTLTITADDASKVYDGTALTKNSYTHTTTATGDVIESVTITGSQTTVGSSNNVPSAAVIKKGDVDVTANYNITYVNGTLEVTKKTVKDNPGDGEGAVSIVLTDISVDGFTYNGNGQKPTITVKDGTNADAQVIPTNEYTVTIKDANGNTVDNPTNVGTYTVVITDNDGGNYNVSGTTTFVINQKALTITADDASKVYDGQALTKNSYTNSALATGDAITSVTITGSQTNVGTSNNVPSAAVIKKGDVDVTANYNITYVNGTLEVTKKTVKDNPGDGEGTVNIVLTDISVDGFTYNGNGQKPTITVKDGTNADAQVIPASEYTVTIKDANGNTVDNPTNVGTYTVVITDNDGGNYDVSGETTFTINKKTLNITANDQEKAAGSDDPTLTYTQDGLLAGDAITGVLSRAAGETVGTYAIMQGTLSAGNNYTINFTEATLTIYRDLNIAETFSGTNEWASMIALEDLAVPAGMAAYIVTGVSGNTVITKEISYIPAGVPIILQKKDNNASGKATAGTGTDDVSENLLKGSATEASPIQPYKDYVLYNGRFELAGVSSVPAGKVYLPATALSGTAAPSFLVIGNETTSLSPVPSPSREEGNQAWYTLDGRKLDKKPTQKGVYVNGGRKVVVK